MSPLGSVKPYEVHTYNRSEDNLGLIDLKLMSQALSGGDRGQI